MADLDWMEVINNPNAYPDAMLVRDLGAEGERLVALRKQVVPRSLADRAVTQERTRAQAYADEKRVLEQQLAYALAGPVPGQETETRASGVNYQADPILNPLYTEAHSAHELARQQAKELETLKAETERLKAGIAQIPTIMRLEQLRAQDPTLDPAKLIEFAKAKQQSGDLADFHKLMVFDREVAAAKERGIAEGLERAKQDMLSNPAVPYAPYGPPQTVTPQAQKFESPDAMEAAILQDMDIINLFQNAA